MNNINKYIEICGIGNGLVDIQYEIEDNELLHLGYSKGEMRLLTIDEHKELLSKLNGRNYYRCSGGSAANTIISYSGFGGKTAFKTVLGNDEIGNFFENEFRQMSIELASTKVQHLPTGTCIILISPDSERTMLTCLGATALFNIKHLQEDLIKNAQWLYIEGYMFSEQASTEAILKAVELAQKHNTKIAITFSDYFITENFKEQIRKIAENSDLVFCNENEAKSFTNTTNLNKAIEILSSITKNFCITLGSNGSVIFWDDKTYNIPAYKTKAIDSTGAGDIFAAGYLWGIIHKNDPEIAGHLASLSASYVVSQYGARLKKDHKEIRDKILKKFQVTL